MKILISGAAGFIGSHLAAHLADRGHEVIGFDNFNDYYSVELKRARVARFLKSRQINCVQLDLCDEAGLRALFASFKPQAVVHLAAQAGVRYSLTNPGAYFQSNLVGQGNVLELCRAFKVEHLAFASSSSVYGQNSKVPFHEDDPVDRPISLYAATKRAGELMAYSYSHLYDLPLTGLRFFTVYGPWGRPDMAYYSFTQKILAGAPIPVFAEGKLKRDFTYIDDIVEGIRRLIEVGPAQNKPPFSLYNIGNHTPVQVSDFIQILERHLGKKAVWEHLPMQPGDVEQTFADTSRLNSVIDFVPKTSLETGLKNFVRWYQDFYHAAES
jgi:UDP-glucuronate 4-epimerase